MVKSAFLSFLVTQSVFAGYECVSLDDKLLIQNSNMEKVQVLKTGTSGTTAFKGFLSKADVDGLYKSFTYELVDEKKEHAVLTVTSSPRFGRGCGRACAKSFPIETNAQLIYLDDATHYACTKNNL